MRRGVLDAAIVTLDRVVCCYPRLEALLNAAADRKGRALGRVYPRPRWGTRVVLSAGNLFLRLRAGMPGPLTCMLPPGVQPVVQWKPDARGCLILWSAAPLGLRCTKVRRQFDCYFSFVVQLTIALTTRSVRSRAIEWPRSSNSTSVTRFG